MNYVLTAPMILRILDYVGNSGVKWSNNKYNHYLGAQCFTENISIVLIEKGG